MANRVFNPSQNQIVFLRSFMDALLMFSVPLSISHIKDVYKYSEGRIRSQTSALISCGVICCTGQAKSRVYSPTSLFRDIVCDMIGEDSETVNWDALLIDGICQTPGCGKRAVDGFRSVYYCRDCMMECDSDMEEVRSLHELTWAVKSSAGQIAEFAVGNIHLDINR